MRGHSHVRLPSVHNIFGSRALLLFGELLQFTLAIPGKIPTIYILSNVHYGSTCPFHPIQPTFNTD